MTLSTLKSIEACAARYGEDAEAMRSYLINGERHFLRSLEVS